MESSLDCEGLESWFELVGLFGSSNVELGMGGCGVECGDCFCVVVLLVVVLFVVVFFGVVGFVFGFCFLFFLC